MLVATRWIWLVAASFALLGGIITVAVAPNGLEWAIFAGTAVYAGVALPAAVAITQGRRWAAIALLVLDLLALAMAVQCVVTQSWPAMVFSLILLSTAAMLLHPTSRRYTALTGQSQAPAPS